MRFINRNPKTIMETNSTELLRAVRDDVVQCIQCDLCKTRRNVVVGYGNHNADIMFIGEAPGEEEDKMALPFVGPAGNVLDKLLFSIGLKREDVYICNTVKCRPPMNADPTDEQKNECASYLTRQIEAIRPKIIACLGNHAARSVLTLFGLADRTEPISKMHGQIYVPGELFKVNSSDGLENTKIMPIFHPAAMLHNPALAMSLKSDFKKLKEAIELTKTC